MQTAEQAGISLKSVAATIEELRDTAEKSAAAVIIGLGNSVPESVFEPIQKGIIERVGRLGITDE